jgi:hypothetical protein
VARESFVQENDMTRWPSDVEARYYAKQTRLRFGGL